MVMYIKIPIGTSIKILIYFPKEWFLDFKIYFDYYYIYHDLFNFMLFYSVKLFIRFSLINQYDYYSIFYI